MSETARTLADEILKAAGSALRYYEAYSQNRIIAVAQRFLDEASSAQEIADRSIGELANRIHLEMTSGACPEQYDATLDGKIIGYLRLRHGYFRVDYPECGAETVFEASPRGDGVFEPDERDGLLSEAKRALARAILRHPGLAQQGDAA